MPYRPAQAVVPPEIAPFLPPLDLLEDVLLNNLVVTPAGQHFVRAAWNAASVWPRKVTRTFRFGPPESLAGERGYPYHWVYATDHVFTAAWEAQLCVNDVTRPGTFFVRPGAEKAIISKLSFSQPISLFDIAGPAASKLGIYDNLHSPDHAWCQWFGWQLDQLIAGQNGKVHGVRYPSRRHPGHRAYAISSRVMRALSKGMSSTHVTFGASPDFKLLVEDRCRTDPP